MTDEIVASDVAIVDLLRKSVAMTVVNMATELDVTATAVRQRLTRLMAQGFVARTVTKAGRGRPSHHYALTTKGRRKAGSNFGDLAVALWKEIVAIEDPAVRRALIQRVSRRLAEAYQVSIEGQSVGQRMDQLALLFRDRRVSFSVDHDGEKPRLTALSCPYPDLAGEDRTICAMDREILAKLLGTRLRLVQCRQDGDSCCSFEPEVTEVETPARELAAGG